MHEPLVLGIASHKSGTGRTTAAGALAWLWGQRGVRVTLADADTVQAVHLLAGDASGRCLWDNVQITNGMPTRGDPGADADLIIVDCPSLMDASVYEVLKRCHGIVLACVADPLSLRTVPAAATALATARVANPQLELLGVLIGLFSELDVVQAPMLERLRQMHGDLLLEPPIPYELAIRDWALTPGSPLPPGRAADAFAMVRRRIDHLVRQTFHVDISGGQLAGRA